jgi:ribose/xylose/arabinose/galactoside ABC-type transport system permease subunit
MLDLKSKSQKKFQFNDYILEIVLIVLMIVIATLTPGFMNSKNLLNMLKNVSLQGVIALGLTMTIIGGQIDLSVGSGVALYGVIVAKVSGDLSDAGIMPLESAVLVGMLVAFITSFIVGSIIAWLHIRFKMPTFIITLAFLNILYGAAALLSNGFPITSLPLWYNEIGAGRIGGVPVPAIILLVIFIIVFIIMKYTRIGREIYAVGGNEESARLCGINIKKIKTFYLIAPQLMACVSAILISSQVMSASSQFGRGYEMTAIPSVIIGGAALSGGVGTVWGTFLGMIFLGVISNGMTILNVNEFTQYVVKGVLILVAVAVNTIMENRKLGA